jgi:hypothetical protein
LGAVNPTPQKPEIEKPGRIHVKRILWAGTASFDTLAGRRGSFGRRGEELPREVGGREIRAPRAAGSKRARLYKTDS